MYYKGDVVELLQPIYHPSEKYPEFKVGSRLKVKKDSHGLGWIDLDVNEKNSHWHSVRCEFVIIYKRPIKNHIKKLFNL